MHKFRSEVKWSCSVVSNSCDTMDCSLPGFSIHGISQSRILEWVAISFSSRSSWPRDWTWVSRIVGRQFTVWATREVHVQKRRLLFHKETHVNIFHFIWLEVFSICTRVCMDMTFTPALFCPLYLFPFPPIFSNHRAEQECATVDQLWTSAPPLFSEVGSARSKHGMLTSSMLPSSFTHLAGIYLSVVRGTVTPNSHPPRASACDLTWTQDLCGCNQVRVGMTSYWIKAGPKFNDQCPHNKRKVTDGGENRVKTEADWSDIVRSQRMPARRNKEEFSHRLFRGSMALPTHLNCGLQVSRTMRQ